MPEDPYQNGAYRPRNPSPRAYRPGDADPGAYRPREPNAYVPRNPNAHPPRDAGYRPRDPGRPLAPPLARKPQAFPYVVVGLIILVGIAGVGGFTAGRITAKTPSSPAASASTAASASAAPATAAAAKSAAAVFFALYAAGQYAATYPLLDTRARQQIPEATWVTVHQDCKSSASGLSYKVGAPTVAGNTAVMSVSLAGVASSLGSGEETFIYQGGKWLFAPSDLSSYKNTAAQTVATLKAAGTCG